MRSTRKSVLVLVAVAALALPLAYFFVQPFGFRVLVVLVVAGVALSTIYWFGIALVNLANTVRFGAKMTLDEIRSEEDPVRMAKLLRYHLGWSPGKIAAEMNRWGIRNHGLPWREDDVRRAVKGATRVF